MFRREWNILVRVVFTVAIAFLPRASACPGHVGHASLIHPGDHRGKDRVCVRRRHLGGELRRREPETSDVAPRRGTEPVLRARWQAHRVHSQLRRQRGRLCDPHRGGRAVAADLAPGRRHRARLHARRQGALQLATGGLLAAARPVLHDRHRGRRPAAAAGPDRRQGSHLAGWEIPGLHAAGRELPAMEELSRWNRLADLDPQAGRPVARGDPQARRRLQ